MADVVLVQPIIGMLDQVKDKPAIPLSLITASCNLKPDFSVKIIDQRVDKNWQNTLLNELGLKPYVVGTTAMLGEEIKHALKVVQYVKEHSDVPTIWGGSQGSIMPQITIKNQYIDYLIQGDAEIALPKLVRAVANKQSVENIAGIWTKQGNKVPFEQVELNEQNEPIYDYFADRIYDYMPTRFGYPTMDCEISRGCPFHCAMCYQPFMNKSKWRALEIEKVKDRILRLNKKYAIQSFWFIDDEYFIDIERAKNIIQFMFENHFKWSIQGVTIRSIAKMDKDYLVMLKKAGCKQLNIGVESGSEKILKMIHKPITIDEVLQINKRLKEVDIIPSYYFIVGFPDEDKQDFYDTLNLVSRVLRENPNAKIMNLGTYTPYPNSELEKRCIELGYKPPDKLEDYISFGVDRENTPWTKNNKDIIGANFCNYFLDKKINDLEIKPYLKSMFKLYQPIAKYRFNHKYFGLPLDIKLGLKVKEFVRK